VNSGLPLRSFPFDGEGVTAVVTTRHGGVSVGPYASLNLGAQVGDDQHAVRQNRGRVAAALGVDRLTIAAQRHTNRVAVVDRANAGRGHDGVAGSVSAFPATDGLITDLPGTALAVVVADCAPVVLFDPVHRAIGVAHCGRAGTVSGMLPNTVEAMAQAYGSSPQDLLVGIGPTIRADSYEVGDAEAAEVTAAFGPDAAGLLTPTRPGHCTLDLVGGLRVQLRRAGVKYANVHDMGIDTRTNADDFFSHRAARPSGRFAAVALLPSFPS
jgi:polyphenol oxidase